MKKAHALISFWCRPLPGGLLRLFLFLRRISLERIGDFLPADQTEKTSIRTSELLVFTFSGHHTLFLLSLIEEALHSALHIGWESLRIIAALLRELGIDRSILAVPPSGSPSSITEIINIR